MDTIAKQSHVNYNSINNFFLRYSFHPQKKGDGEQTEEEATKPPLTGIPQIDYIWDPNLPRELNG